METIVLFGGMPGMKIGLLIRKGSLWIGAHWSPYNRRWCINLLPCLTIWVVMSGGNVPDPKGSLVYLGDDDGQRRVSIAKDSV